MHPMRVEWSEPDEAKRAVAMESVRRDRERFKMARYDQYTSDMQFALASRCSDEEREEVWLKRHPDLNAEVTYFGTLLSVRYVPAQYAARHFDGGATAGPSVKLCDSKWVALVATEHGTQEMDPTKLRVMWPMSACDPIGGKIGDDMEISRMRRLVELADKESAK